MIDWKALYEDAVNALARRAKLLELSNLEAEAWKVNFRDLLKNNEERHESNMKLLKILSQEKTALQLQLETISLKLQEAERDRERLACIIVTAALGKVP